MSGMLRMKLYGKYPEMRNRYIPCLEKQVPPISSELSPSLPIKYFSTKRFWFWVWLCGWTFVIFGISFVVLNIHDITEHLPRVTLHLPSFVR